MKALITLPINHTIPNTVNRILILFAYQKSKPYNPFFFIPKSTIIPTGHRNANSTIFHIQERKVKPVGSDKEIAFDVRIISATNENLTKAVAEGNFREDLYHRLNEFSLKALSLRERKEDIPVFANHFLAASNEELGKDVIGFEDEVMSVFKNYNWPGNLREMRNVVKRATLLCLGDFISLKDIPAELAAVDPVPQIEDLALKREKNEVQLIREALAKCHNNKSEAARLLKIDRKTLYNKMKLYSIE